MREWQNSGASTGFDKQHSDAHTQTHTDTGLELTFSQMEKALVISHGWKYSGVQVQLPASTINTLIHAQKYRPIFSGL